MAGRSSIQTGALCHTRVMTRPDNVEDSHHFNLSQRSVDYTGSISTFCHIHFRHIHFCHIHFPESSSISQLMTLQMDPPASPE